MFTQPKDPNNKTKPAYKKYCSYCHRTNHSISACFKKQRDDEEKRDAYARLKSPQKSFVQYFRSPSNDRKNNTIIDIKVEVLHVTTLTTKLIHKIDIVLHPETDSVMIKVLLLHTTLDHVMILTNAIHALIVHHTDLLRDHLIDTILAQDTDHVPIPETIILQNIQTHTDHLPDQEIPDFIDLALTPTLEIKSI